MGLFGKKSSAPPAQGPPPQQPQKAAAEPDMFETVFNMKFTAKQLGKLSKKSEMSAEAEKKKCKTAIEKGNVEGAKIHAENAIRNQKQSVVYLRLQSRVDAVVAKLDARAKMAQVFSGMSSVTTSLSSALEEMDMTKISTIMDTFERQFEDLDVQGQYMDSAIADATASSTPQSDVNNLLQQVADEHNLKVTSELLGGVVPTKQATAAPAHAASQADGLEERFKRLQG